MLVSLHVKNMALIKEVEVEFGEGLNIMTGETGAGKSIVIGSVNIALGTGNFKDYVPEDADYALVELVFRTENPKVEEKLQRQDLPFEDHEIIITRKYKGGRASSKINGETVPVSFVRELAGDKIGFRVSCRRGFLYDKNDIAMKESLEKNGQTQFATAIDFDELCGNDYFKAVFVSEPQILSDTFDIIKKEFPMYDYTRSYIWLTELMPKGISKSTQLKFIMSEARKTNPNAKLYCVGDFDNDADMLRVADVAMCPENATDEIKKLCSVRLCHAKDGAIADAIEKIEAGL